MKSILNCHFNYLFNKITIITLGGVIVFSGIGFVFGSEYLVNNGSSSLNNYNYYYNCHFIIKLMGIFMFVFLFGNSFLPKNDQYSHLLLTSNVSRSRYFVLKLLSLGFVVLIFIWLMYFLYTVIGFWKSVHFTFEIMYLESFFSLFLLICFYSLLSLVLVQISNNIYTIILPIALINILSSASENAQVHRDWELFFLNFEKQGITLVFGIKHALILISLLFFINLLIFLKKDL
ncbi:MAG: hypothetical protein AB7T03_05405 [Bacilli bacterium]